MEIKYNVTGAKRKELVNLIANFTGCKAKYKGAPTFAYEIDYFTIDKNGTLSFDDRADSEVIERLLEMLYDNSFAAESAEDAETGEEPETLCGSIFVPRTQISDSGLENLKKLIAAKGYLIKKSLGLDELIISEDTDNISFPWIAEGTAPDDVKHIMDFITALCKMANEAKRVTAKEKHVDNEKFAMRTFLNRIGFMGTEYKPLRKALLKNLTGNSAFRYGNPENN